MIVNLIREKWLGLLLILVYVFLSFKSALNGGDFDVYLHAAEKMNAGEDMFSPPYFKQDLKYYYSPLFAMLLIPFTKWYFLTQFFWLLLSGFWLYRSWELLKRSFKPPVLNNKQLIIWGLLSLFFIIRFLLYNIAMTQITIFIMWGMLESLNAIKNGRWIIGSLLLALVINVKLMPLVLIPYLLYRSYFKETLLTVIFVGIYLFLPSPFIGHEYNLSQLEGWWTLINPIKTEHIIDAGKNPQSLVGTIPVFLTETIGDLEEKRNLFNLSADTAGSITNVVRLFFIALTLYFLRRPFKRDNNAISEYRAIAYLFMIVPLIFPRQQKYAFIFIFPMVIYLVYYCMLLWNYNRSKGFKIFLGLLLLLSIVFTPIIGSDVIGRRTYDLFHHFRFLGLGTVCLVVFALLASPKKINQIIASNSKS